METIMSAVHADQKFTPENWWTKYDNDPDFITARDGNEYLVELSRTKPVRARQIMIQIWDQLDPEDRANLAQYVRSKQP
jgi:hypothetical protein